MMRESVGRTTSLTGHVSGKENVLIYMIVKRMISFVIFLKINMAYFHATYTHNDRLHFSGGHMIQAVLDGVLKTLLQMYALKNIIAKIAKVAVGDALIRDWVGTWVHN